ncbi:MAG: cupin domain-containing protein [Candidatus Sumerlaeaceae bacterium]|nr:cupin domain-containing protein [Candidatus Sumerlaeaceae bacterium]
MCTGIFYNISQEITVPDDGTLSRTLYRDDVVKVVLFGFAPGQELSEHTAAVPAILHFLEGEANVGIAGRSHDAGPGSWFYMQANTPHTITAKTPVKMLR